MFRSKGNHIRDTYSMAGWLFADLLLGLAMLFLVSNTVGPKPIPTPTFTPTATSTITPTRTPTSTSTPLAPGGGVNGTEFVSSSTPTLTTTPLGAIGLSSPQCYALYLSDNDISSQQTYLVKELKKILPNDTEIKAGMMIVWGNGGDSLEGRRIAQLVGSLIRNNFGESFDKNTQEKNLFLDTGDRNRVLIEVYFFTDSIWKSGFEVNCNSRW